MSPRRQEDKQNEMGERVLILREKRERENPITVSARIRFSTAGEPAARICGLKPPGVGRCRYGSTHGVMPFSKQVFQTFAAVLWSPCHGYPGNPPPGYCCSLPNPSTTVRPSLVRRRYCCSGGAVRGEPSRRQHPFAPRSSNVPQTVPSTSSACV